MCVTLILLLLLFACSTILDDASRKQLLKEGGPVEVASAVLYLVCVAYAIFKGGVGYFKKYPYFIIIPLVFALRELDFDKRFTTVGLLKSKFVFSPLVPLHEKLIGIPILAVIVLMLVMMLKRHLRTFWDELKKGSVTGVGVAMLLLFNYYFSHRNHN
jgi:hypothetical protein